LHQKNTKSRLKENMVFTSEPGIYLKEFGVRIEDVALVRGEEMECEVLSGRRADGPWDP
jgi:Xaa-Pro aminopeptidase